MNKRFVLFLAVVLIGKCYAGTWVSTNQPGWLVDADSVSRKGDLASVDVRGNGKNMTAHFDCKNRYLFITEGPGSQGPDSQVSIDHPNMNPAWKSVFDVACANAAARQINKLKGLLN
jgi:hypothetical protein